jgi:hypothetical protein
MIRYKAELFLGANGRAKLSAVTRARRHRTTALFAALDVPNDTVHTECKPPLRRQAFLAAFAQERSGHSAKPGHPFGRG